MEGSANDLNCARWLGIQNEPGKNRPCRCSNHKPHRGPPGANEKTMKKTPEKKTESEMRSEYDFSRGVRGKYARRYVQGTNVVVIEPDVAKVFPSAQDVNRSLRALAGIIRQRRIRWPRNRRHIPEAPT